MFKEYCNRLVNKFYGTGKFLFVSVCVWLVSLVCFSIFGLISFWVFFQRINKYTHKLTAVFSQAVRDGDKISMTKSISGNNRVETIVTAEETIFKKNTVDVWPNCGYFKQQPCKYGTDKKNMPENSIIYPNQGYQSYKDNQKVYYADVIISYSGR